PRRRAGGSELRIELLDSRPKEVTGRRARAGLGWPRLGGGGRYWAGWRVLRSCFHRTSMRRRNTRRQPCTKIHSLKSAMRAPALGRTTIGARTIAAAHAVPTLGRDAPSARARPPATTTSAGTRTGT